MIPITNSTVQEELNRALNLHTNHAECIRALVSIYFTKREEPMSAKDITRLMLAIEMQANTILIAGIDSNGS